MSKTSVLVIGLEPSLIDFSEPAYAATGLTAGKVMAGLEADEKHLNALGYETELCLTDFGETAETVVRERLERKRFDCVLIGAGVRLIAQNTPLFEKLINAVHETAPQAKLCFNTKPTDTAEAVLRWATAGEPKRLRGSAMTRIDDHDAIVQLVQLYMDGAAHGDVPKLRHAFHADARMFGEVDGKRFDMTMEPFFELSAAHPLNSDGSYRGRLISVYQVGDAAVAIVAEDGCWGSVSFVDFLSLSRVDGTWKIVNKSFTHTGGTMPGG